MHKSGVIYQYIDRPADPDKILLDAISFDEPVIDIQSNAARLPERGVSDIVLRAFEVPHTVPVRVINDSVKKLKERLSFSFRAMIGGGVLGMLVLLSPLIITEAQIMLHPPQPVEDIVFPDIEIVEQTVDMPTFSQLVNDKYVAKLNPVSSEYSIVIPKIGINSPVTANVDPGDKSEYTEALKHGAAHAEGTALPDEAGSKFIFAHSADYVWNVNAYNSLFYLIKDLEEGDQVHIIYNGTLYPYKVTDKMVVDPGDTYYLKRNLNDSRLILQTCWPPGTTWKRMLVFAEPIDSVIGIGNDVSYNIDKQVTE